MRGENLTKTSH